MPSRGHDSFSRRRPHGRQVEIVPLSSANSPSPPTDPSFLRRMSSAVPLIPFYSASTIFSTHFLPRLLYHLHPLSPPLPLSHPLHSTLPLSSPPPNSLLILIPTHSILGFPYHRHPPYPRLITAPPSVPFHASSTPSIPPSIPFPFPFPFPLILPLLASPSTFP